jgi:superfamily I DNA/RNA helicase
MTEKIREPARFVAWASYSEYEATAKASKGAEMLQSVAIIQKFSPLPVHVAMLRKYEVRDEKVAAVTVTTVHRAKGLEWNTVRLHEDFQELDQPGPDNGKRAARTVLTGMCYSVGSATRQGSSSPTRFIGQSAMTSRT